MHQATLMCATVRSGSRPHSFRAFSRGLQKFGSKVLWRALNFNDKYTRHKLYFIVVNELHWHKDNMILWSRALYDQEIMIKWTIIKLLYLGISLLKSLWKILFKRRMKYLLLLSLNVKNIKIRICKKSNYIVSMKILY